MTWTCPICLKDLKYEDDDYNKYRKWNHYMTHTKYELATYMTEKEQAKEK